LKEVDGVMIGREAYYNPWLLTTWDAEFFNANESSITREAVEEAMVTYMERAFKEDGCPWYAIARHMLGLYHGQRGGRLWRQVWSNHKLKPMPPRDVMAIALEALAKGAEVTA
jgi:tRNA-dihydrouridine synthase A